MYTFPLAARGVYKFRGKIFGRSAYYALTSSEDVLDSCLHIVSDRESDAEIVSRLFVALDRAEAETLRDGQCQTSTYR